MLKYISVIILLLFLNSCKDKPEPVQYPFENEIQNYEAIDKKTPTPDNPILFVGSSSIRMWKTLEEDMAPLIVINRGFGGSQAHQVIHYLDRIVLPYNPKAIVVYEGDNDIASGKSPQQFVDECKKIVQLVHDELSNVPILFLSVKPSFSRIQFEPQRKLANQLLLEYCETGDLLKFIDVSATMFDESDQLKKDIFLEDQLHMNEKGYQLWIEIIKAELLSLPE